MFHYGVTGLRSLLSLPFHYGVVLFALYRSASFIIATFATDVFYFCNRRVNTFDQLLFIMRKMHIFSSLFSLGGEEIG